MVTKILMPQLGESVVEGIIGKWLKKEGDPINQYEPLVEVITDKVDVEVPSPVSGTVQNILALEGATVAIGEEIAVIEESMATRTEAIAPEPAGVAARPDTEQGTEDLEGLRQRATPAVRQLAQEHGIDLSQLKGSGAAGRVTKEDVLQFVASQAKSARSSDGQVTADRPLAAPEPETRVQEEAMPLTPMRRMIAEHMVRSKQTSPHAWAIYEVDVTNLVRARERIKEEFRNREGVDLTYLPFIIKTVAETLKEHPILNASWGGDKINLNRHINISVAIALEGGLIVPVIRDADTKSIAQLAKELADLVSRAKAGTLALQDVQGGTFTVNNTGAFGTVMSMPIINQPQAAILTTELIAKRPVVIDDAIAIRSMMNMCISFDHRILDGATLGRFMQAVKKGLESIGPDPFMIEGLKT